MRVNNFKELEREQIVQYERNTEKVHKSINSNVGILSFIGDIFELYFSRIFGLFVSATGGSPKAPDDHNSNGRPKYPNTI